MRILFLCSSLEKEKDGIGDYTRKLAASVEKSDVEVLLLSFNDKYIKEQTEEEGQIPVIRIPQELTWKQKSDKISLIIKKFAPDWISIQFVIYGIQLRGIIFSSISFFKEITRGRKVHVMFHELWIAEEKQAWLKDKFIGRIQKAGILTFIKDVKPLVVHSSMPLYCLILQRNKVSAKTLPLFSNIPVVINNNTEWIWETINNQTEHEIDLANRKEILIGGIFGSFYYSSWNLHSLMIQLQREHDEHGRKIILLSFGKLGETLKYWNELKNIYKFCSFIVLGPQPEEKISQCLQVIDFGIITTPALIVGKSGSYMAMKEHGVRVFCKKSDLSFNYQIDIDKLIDPYLNQVGEETIDFSNKFSERNYLSQLGITTSIFLNDLKIS